jgi:hypothetical protein
VQVRRAKGGSAKAARERARRYELREAEAWEKCGWRAQPAWRQAIYIGAGKLITKPRDFFDAFDLILVHVDAARIAFVQVTETPFVKVRDGKSDRNAAHGEPPFDFAPGSLEPGDRTVDWWMRGVDDEDVADLGLGTVIVSYADSRAPERRWWIRKP